MTLQQRLKIEFIRHQTSGAKIARKLGVTRHAVYHVLAGRSKSERIRTAIAEAVGMKPQNLWD